MVEEILPNLFRVQIPMPGSPLKYLNSYVIRSEGRNLIIDTGLNQKDSLEVMLAGLKELGLNRDRTDFFITHGHADHFALISKLVTETSRVFVSPIDAEAIKAEGSWEEKIHYAGKNGFPEDQLLEAIGHHPGYRFGADKTPDMTLIKDGDTIHVGDYGFQCIVTPGHTKGHTCLYEPGKKVLVSGDHVLGDITPNISCWSDHDNPLKNYLTSLERVSVLEISLVLPGHRRLLNDPKVRIKELEDHHHHRTEEILVILDSGPKNAFQVASKMTWNVDFKSWDAFPLAQKWFATGEAISHLRYLEKKGKVFKKIGLPAMTYSCNSLFQ